MKYAENNRISQRQLYRQMILTFLALFLICLTGNTGVQGISGAVGIVLAQAVVGVYVFFLMRSSYGYTDPVKTFGKYGSAVLGLFYVSYLILSGVYILSIIEKVVPVWLISGISTKWLSLLAVLVCSYGMSRGMQRRGRLAEVVGGFFLIVVLLLPVLCLGQGNLQYLNEMFAENTIGSGTILEDMYKIICAFSGIGLLPFAMKDIENRGNAGRTLLYVIMTLGGILLAVTFLLPSVLGWRRLQTESSPILPLLAGASLPGNILARFDVLWMGVLLFSVFFALGSVFYYGSQILDSVHLGSGRIWLPVLIYVMGNFGINGMKLADYYADYLKWIFVPGLVLIQIGLFMRGKQKRKKRTAEISVFLLALILGISGCAGMEPEKRMYPLALGINVEEGEYVISYGMPDLPQANGQGANEKENSASVLTIRGNDFTQIQNVYKNTQEKYLDIGHLQVIILGKNLMDSGQWKEFLKYLKQEPLVGENIYLFCAEDPKEILMWDSNGTSVGKYLTGLLENQSIAQTKRGVTLRQVYDQWYQVGSLKELPEIILSEDQIQIL